MFFRKLIVKRGRPNRPDKRGNKGWEIGVRFRVARPRSPASMKMLKAKNFLFSFKIFYDYR